MAGEKFKYVITIKVAWVYIFQMAMEKDPFTNVNKREKPQMLVERKEENFYGSYGLH